MVLSQFLLITLLFYFVIAVGNGWIFDHPGASEFCEWYGGGLIQHSDQEVVDFIIESDMMEGSV